MDVVQIYKPAQKAFQRRIAECGNSEVNRNHAAHNLHYRTLGIGQNNAD